MSKDTSTKYRKFVYKAIMAWTVAIGLIVLLKSIVYGMGGVEASELATWLNDMSSAIFMFGVCGIPIILFFSVGLRLAEGKIGRGENNSKEDQ